MFKISSIAALAGFLFGFDTGIISSAIFFIQATFGLDTFMTQVVVSVVLLGALLGSLCSAHLVNKLGRRSVIEINALLFIISTLGSALAPSLTYLILARAAVGFAIGIACYAVPLYISEIAPARFRGGLVALNTIAVTGGIFISYLAGYFLSSVESWRWMLGIGVVPAVFLLIGVQFLPETPRWLLKKGKLLEARQVLSSIRENASVTDQELDLIGSNLKDTPSYWKELFHPKIRKLLLIGITLAVIQQITGINTILYYAPFLFQAFGYQSTSAIMLLTLGVGLMNFLMTIVVAFKVDRMGRRSLLLYGLAGMTISLLMLATSLKCDLQHPLAKWITLIALFAFIAAYASSIGCIFWIVISEIYPLNIRGAAMGIASTANWSANLMISLTFLSLLHAVGPSLTFFLYAIAGLLSFLFCYLWLPETTQQSLEALEAKVYTESPN
jgi:SP family galactose:H+ symporter-like MFS transporter